MTRSRILLGSSLVALCQPVRQPTLGPTVTVLLNAIRPFKSFRQRFPLEK